MKKIFGVILAPLFWLLNSCSPIGDAVDKDSSTNYYYGKDKKDIFYSRGGNWFALGKRPLNAHVASFKVLNTEIAQDQNNLYYQYSKVDTSMLDMASLYSKTKPFHSNLVFDKNGVYNIQFRAKENQPATIAPFKNADPKTFEHKDFNWAFDAKNWYYRNQLIAVNYDNFEIITAHFSKDKERAYYHYGNSFNILDADAESFQKLEQAYYAKDKNNVFFLYYDGTDNFKNTKIMIIPLQGEIPDFISEAYLKIGSSIYCNGSKLNLNIDNAAVVGDFYIKDESKVYYFNEELPDADPETFTLNEEGFVGDKTSLFRGKERFNRVKDN